MNSNKFDHIKLGKQLRHFVYAPAILPDTAGFEDGLKETAIEKIKELLELADETKKLVKDQLNIAAKNSKEGTLERCVLKMLPTYHVKEYLIIKKWLRYWSEIWRKISDKPLPARLSNKMNYYGQFEIEQARQVPLESFYKGNLRRVGQRLTGLCPFHEEKSPSFVIYEDQNTYHCFGCGAHGDAIEFIEKTKELDFPEAIKYLL
jgi:hypothetical protein